MSFYRKAKKGHQQANSDPKKITICLQCGIPSRQKKSCSDCQGELYEFDSLMEANRYIDLKNSPYITDLKIQRTFKIALPIAIYTEGSIVGNRSEPQFKGYSAEYSENSNYKIDFTYYDSTTLRGWVAEESKPCLIAFDTDARKKLTAAYDQHHRWGEFCVSFPEQNLEGRNIQSYKRLFVSKKTAQQKKPRYQDFNQFFQIRL